MARRRRKGIDGRTADGRFAVGNTFARRRPKAEVLQELDAEIGHLADALDSDLAGELRGLADELQRSGWSTGWANRLDALIERVTDLVSKDETTGNE